MQLRMVIAGVFALTLAGAFFTAAEQDTAAMIKTLQEQIQALQKQLAELQAQSPAEAAPVFAKTLRRGSRDPEVRRLQEFLKGLPEFYPQGLVTGYFGALTEEAVKRFQKTNGLDAVGVVGPKTRAKLNELLAAKKETPPPAAAPPQAPPPLLILTPATTTPPVSTPLPATTTPPAAPATTTPPVQTATPAPILPTPYQLGQPMISFFGWGKNYLQVQFTHEPASYTRSYAVYLRKPGAVADTKFGPYAIMDIGSTSTSTADNTVFKRTGPISWEWTRTVDLALEAEGTFQVSITAVGEGNVESIASPGRIATLYPQALFEDLLEGAPVQAVRNLTLTRFPLTMRIANFYSELYYYYTIWDGETRVWDSAYITSSASPRVEAAFQNVNGYPFAGGKNYRLRVDVFDNNTGKDSAIKQKSNELILTYSP